MNYLGGTFAPPLSDEALAKYEKMAAQFPDRSQIKEAFLKLLACCKQWWELPESSGAEARAHPVGVGVIVPLETSIADSLWEAIPWKDELKAYGKLFDTIQQVEANHNTQKLDGWYAALASAEPEMFKRLSERVGGQPPLNWKEQVLTAAEKHRDSIPRPKLEDTSLRNAAFHLLWHVVELDLDREPLTSDKLAK